MGHIPIKVCWQVTYTTIPATSIFTVIKNGRKTDPESKGNKFRRVASRRSSYMFVSLSEVTYQRLIVSQSINF
jgi:hypothetical protein